MRKCATKVGSYYCVVLIVQIDCITLPDFNTYSLCFRFEANAQMARDKMVEVDMIRILRQRAEDCKVYEGTGGDFFKDENDSKCRDLFVSIFYMKKF